MQKNSIFVPATNQYRNAMTSLKNFFLITTTLCSFLCASAEEYSSQIYTSGVSLELAQKRKTEIKNIHYQLLFQIPETKSTPIKGEESIFFTFNKNISDVIIDFKAESSQLKKVEVNGNQVPFTFQNEHIILNSTLFSLRDNKISILFIAGDKPLNRNTDYLYTLFVPDHARQAFPCFDQPDLKARFSLTLEVPIEWKTIAGGKQIKETDYENRKKVLFKETEPISTYLFSFVTGKFETKSSLRDGRQLNAYYRETDSKKIAQLPTIFDQVFSSIKWMEEYTKIPYPFSKYDLIILPGFQFGGMEHIGAVLYNDKRMFISERPTPDEELSRVELIAHETAHSWFGDMVTMKWFNDVWTKEVFANYMASKISAQQFPKINHQLNFLKAYQINALEEDRTAGTHPIQQQLDNLQNAGLLYGNIIYQKAPVMMRNLEFQMGSEAFRRGLQKYLRRYAFSNADWDNLIDILSNEAPHAKLKEFSEVWAKQKGMPDITAKLLNGKIIVTQNDPLGRGCLWQQHFKMAISAHGNVSQIIDINMKSKTVVAELKNARGENIIPNYDGTGYGRFITDNYSTQRLLKEWDKGEDINREAVLITIYENFLMHKLQADDCAASLLEGLKKEKNALIASTCCNYLSTIVFHQKEQSRMISECEMWKMSCNHAIPSCRQKLKRTLFTLATDTTVIANLYKLWNEQKDESLNEDDYISLSYQLAIRKQGEWESIINKERQRISNFDRRREFDYISRGCTPDEAEQNRLFNLLLQQENRAIEPWAERLLALLNNPLREQFANKYITPGLNALEEIQRTGDIFFPKGWVTALLSGHRSDEARELVNGFLLSHSNYPLPLKNKLLQAAYYLLNK